MKSTSFELYINRPHCELEGVFVSCIEIDKYMDWPKGTASKIYKSDSSAVYSILDSDADDSIEEVS